MKVALPLEPLRLLPVSASYSMCRDSHLGKSSSAKQWEIAVQLVAAAHRSHDSGVLTVDRLCIYLAYTHTSVLNENACYTR